MNRTSLIELFPSQQHGAPHRFQDFACLLRFTVGPNHYLYTASARLGIMAKSAKGSSEVEQFGKPAPGLSLESGDVMRAMLEAAAAAKRSSGDDREESGSESDGESDTDGHDDEEDRSGTDSEEEDNDSPRSNGNNDEDEDEDDSDDRGEGSSTGSTRKPQASTQYSRIPPSVPSRVKAAAATAAAPPKPAAPSDPFGASVRPAEDTSFADLGLSLPLITSLKAIGIKKPTEIQAACVKAILAGRSFTLSHRGFRLIRRQGVTALEAPRRVQERPWHSRCPLLSGSRGIHSASGPSS